jgi:hypothetical protein
MNIDIKSGPVQVFLVGYGFLLAFVLKGIYDSLMIENSGYISWFAALIFGCIMMPIGFYYSIKSCRKKK